jgi:hypothetical protein
VQSGGGKGSLGAAGAAHWGGTGREAAGGTDTRRDTGWGRQREVEEEGGGGGEGRGGGMGERGGCPWAGRRPAAGKRAVERRQPRHRAAQDSSWSRGARESRGDDAGDDDDDDGGR